ncbi:sodium-coupled monocarboxylate transporter 1-like [Lycorma delicatula]|uniref:sodium-coupled monocarboxylate transporter 1-like n=1 Tax=Lycorma delicatula TaxID=130591 RepID=UPI003F50FC37
MYFGWIDSLVFAAMLILSALVGVYFAFFAKSQQNSTSEYLVGGRNMGIFPISMSLIASYISGISLLGLPAEMYVYGTQYWLITASEAFVSLTMIFVYLPVFYTLRITSSYEYLNLRFSSKVRTFGSCLFLLKMLLYIPIVIYVPALAFSQVTGINLHHVTPMVCIVCIFYTSLGGLRAVVWTDSLQTILMVGGALAVVVLGSRDLPPSLVWERNFLSGRIDFANWEVDPTVRHTILSVTFGNYFYWLAACSVNQAMVQRCLSLPTLKQANVAVGILAVGITFLVSISCYTGLLIYAYFYDCDPISAKRIQKSDQLLPYFVMEVAGSVPGLPGIFMAGVFSAALSSMSTGLNSMAGVIYEDLIKPKLSQPLSEVNASRLMKAVVIIIGTICTILVFVVEKLGMLIQAGKSLGAITAGPLLGMFTLGMLFPKANAKGALWGGFTSLALVAWISIGAQSAIARGDLLYLKKPVTTFGCSQLNNSADISSNNGIDFTRTQEIPYLYRLSYLYYTLLGTSTAIFVGIVVSYITGGTKEENPELYAPFINRFRSVKPVKKQKVVVQEHRL